MPASRNRGERWFENSTADLDSHFGHCWLLVQAVLVRVIELAKLTPTICAQMLATYGKNPTGDELSVKMTTGRAKVGDFVIVVRSLARIVRVNRSDYGYESYTVKYLADPPTQGLVEDDVLPYHVRFLRDAEPLRQKLLETMRSVDANVQADPRDLDDSLETGVIELWNLVLRDEVLRQTSTVRRRRQRR